MIFQLPEKLLIAPPSKNAVLRTKVFFHKVIQYITVLPLSKNRAPVIGGVVVESAVANAQFVIILNGATSCEDSPRRFIRAVVGKDAFSYR